MSEWIVGGPLKSRKIPATAQRMYKNDTVRNVLAMNATAPPIAAIPIPPLITSIDNPEDGAAAGAAGFPTTIGNDF